MARGKRPEWSQMKPKEPKKYKKMSKVDKRVDNNGLLTPAKWGRSRLRNDEAKLMGSPVNKARKVVNDGVMQRKISSGNNNAIPVGSTSKGEHSAPNKSRDVEPKRLFTESNPLGNDLDPEAVDMNDGILVTVHAPEGEFEDEIDSNAEDSDTEQTMSDSEVIFNIGNDGNEFESSQNTLPQCFETGNESVTDTPLESVDELMEKYGNNPNFMTIVERMVKKTIGTNETNKESDKPVNSTGESSNNEGTRQQQGNNKEQLKSPSDTTIYAPRLNKLEKGNFVDKDDMLEKISNFVESIRGEVRRATPTRPEAANLRSATWSKWRGNDQPTETDGGRKSQKPSR